MARQILVLRAGSKLYVRALKENLLSHLRCSFSAIRLLPILWHHQVLFDMQTLRRCVSVQMLHQMDLVLPALNSCVDMVSTLKRSMRYMLAPIKTKHFLRGLLMSPLATRHHKQMNCDEKDMLFAYSKATRPARMVIYFLRAKQPLRASPTWWLPSPARHVTDGKKRSCILMKQLTRCLRMMTV